MTVADKETSNAAIRPSDQQIFMVNPKEIYIRSDVRNPNKRVLLQEDVQDLIDSYRDRIKKDLPPIRYPIEVIRDDKDRIIVVAGRRRRRAAIFAKLTEVPVIFVDATRPVNSKDQLMLEISENALRKQLDVLDEARAILKLIDLTAKDIPSYKKMLVTNNDKTPEEVIVDYIKRMRGALRRNGVIAESESIRSPLFRIILDSLRASGKEWSSYFDKVLAFLSYPAPIQELFNLRIIGPEGAKKLKTIRDKGILQAACDFTREDYAKYKAVKRESLIVSNAMHRAFSDSRFMKSVSDTAEIIERSSKDITRFRPAKNAEGWYFNYKFSLDSSNKRDLFNGMTIPVSEFSTDFSLPNSIYERLIKNYTKPTDKLLIVGPATPEAFRIALLNGCYTKYVAPEKTSEYAYRFPLDAITPAGYTAANPKVYAKPGENDSDNGVREGEADLAILVFHPYGEISIADSLSWMTRRYEPSEELYLDEYLEKVGSILKHVMSRTKRIIVVSRVSERKNKLVDVPALVGYALNGMTDGVFYWKDQNGKTWTIHAAITPFR